MCYLRRRFAELFVDSTGRICCGDTGSFKFDNVGAEDVKLFFRHTFSCLRLWVFFVWLSVSSKPRSPPIWLGLNPL